MKTTHRDDTFVCAHCQYTVPKRGGGYCRNHCPKCLHSFHVDLKLPGDRKAECAALMEPVDMIYKGHKGYQIIHQCVKCKYKHAVVVANDDDRDAVVALTKASAENKMMQL
ncbi:RNHCP domain-containing protein [Candidatus Gracilibacteria bacterium]|nr:RNHCP domain-containing protein [Candidatus Gracilibacteria bacterium]